VELAGEGGALATGAGGAVTAEAAGAAPDFDFGPANAGDARSPNTEADTENVASDRTANPSVAAAANVVRAYGARSPPPRASWRVSAHWSLPER
jgi:hypothetical protein